MKNLPLLIVLSFLLFGCSSIKEHFYTATTNPHSNNVIQKSDDIVGAESFLDLNTVQIKSSTYQLQPAYDSASGDVCRIGSVLNSTKGVKKLLICSSSGDAPWLIVPSVIASYNLKG